MGYFKYCGESGVLVLKNLQIKATPPNEFNDPFEFSPVVHNPNPKEYAKKEAKEILTNPRFFDANRFAFPQEIDNYRKFQVFARANLGKVIGMLEANTQELDKSLDVVNMLSETTGVICFSAAPLQPLMWAHYANSHKGLVLEFDETSNFFHPDAFLKVDYAASRVEYNPDGADQRFMVELFARRKSLDWQYEQEYRRIVNLDQTNKQVNGGQTLYLLNIAPELLKSVSFGLRASETMKKEVLSLTEKSPLNHLQVFNTVADENEFKLHRVRIK